MSEVVYETLEGLKVEVEEVIYMPHLDSPEDRPYPFVYFLSIVNESEQAVKILARKWIIKDQTGEILVIEGEGVVGEKPEIGSGKRFSYNSYHVLPTDGVATGSFFGLSSEGKAVRVRVPPFRMKVPE